jgi:hypothetical protein
VEKQKLFLVAESGGKNAVFKFAYQSVNVLRPSSVENLDTDRADQRLHLDSSDSA